MIPNTTPARLLSFNYDNTLRPVYRPITIVGWEKDISLKVIPVCFVEYGEVWCVHNPTTNTFEFPDGNIFGTHNEATRHADKIIRETHADERARNGKADPEKY